MDMEMYNGQLAAQSDELGITTNTLMSLCKRNEGLRLRRGSKYAPALYAVDKLPLKYRNEVYKRNPTLTQHHETLPFIDQIVPDGNALRYYSEYLLKGDRHIPESTQSLLSNDAAILNAFGDLIDHSEGLRKKQDGKRLNKGEFWQRASKSLAAIGEVFPHNLPNNARELQRKYNSYKAEGYEALVNGRMNNANGSKVKDSEQIAVITALLAHLNNLDNSQIANAYNLAAAQNGWPAISAGTVGNWRAKTDLITSAARTGTTNFRSRRSMTVKRERPSSPFLHWSLDGWTCELLYQEGGKYWNRLTLECVIDTYNNYIIGYAIGDDEDSSLITEAVQNAVTHSQELTGEMLGTMQVQCDHFSIKAMMPVYSAIADKVTPAQVKNAKAKPIERFFLYLQETYCKTLDNWAGYGVTTDQQKQPNSEALNQRKKGFPDKAGCRAQIVAMVETDRAKKRGEYLRGYKAMNAENKYVVSRESYLMTFGKRSEQVYQLSKSGIRATILGERREYDCFDINFRLHSDIDWQLRYDISDLSKVMAVSPDGQYRYMLEQKYVQPMALADRKDGDSEQLQRVREFNQELEAKVTEEVVNAQETAARVVSNVPELRSILNRLLLTDDKGQHKKNREQLRHSQEGKAEQDSDYKENDFSIF